MAAKYTGRHIRQARHGAWLDEHRTRPRYRASRRLLPAAATLIVSGVLFGGAGILIQLSPVGSGSHLASYHAGHEAGWTSGPTDVSTSQSLPSDVGSVIATGTCTASHLDQPQGTASGEEFDPEAFTAAHKSLPFDSWVRVTNPANGKSVMVRIIDRGPFIAGRCLDLSRAAFRAIASLNAAAVLDVRYEVLR